MKINPGYEYKGVTYDPLIEHEGDGVVKIHHEAKVGDRHEPVLFSPYVKMTEEMFQNWVNERLFSL